MSAGGTMDSVSQGYCCMAFTSRSYPIVVSRVHAIIMYRP